MRKKIIWVITLIRKILGNDKTFYIKNAKKLNNKMLYGNI